LSGHASWSLAFSEEEGPRRFQLPSSPHEVIPVVASFVEHGSREFQFRQAAGEAMQQIWEGRKPKWQPANLTREQIGLIAIYHLQRRGHEMLAELEIVDGTAIRNR